MCIPSLSALCAFVMWCDKVCRLSLYNCFVNSCISNCALSTIASPSHLSCVAATGKVRTVPLRCPKFMLLPNFARIITMTQTSLVNEIALLSVENIVFIIGFCLTGGYHCLQGTCCLQLSLNVKQCIPLKHCNHKTIWCHNHSVTALP